MLQAKEAVLVDAWSPQGNEQFQEEHFWCVCSRPCQERECAEPEQILMNLDFILRSVGSFGESQGSD